jgi:hypothetical protein
MHRVTMAATLLIGLALTAGCSGSEPGATAGAAILDTARSASTETPAPLAGLSALEVWEKTKTAADAAESVHVAARFLDGKEKVTINLKLADEGKAFGVLVLNGDRIRIRRLGSTLYFRADYGFWEANADAATAEELADKWIMVKQGFSTDLDQFFELTDMDSIVADTMSLSSAQQQQLKLVPGVDVGDRTTVGLADESTENTDDVQTLYVSADNPAFPMNFAMNADNSQYMKFRGWNKAFKVVAPPGAIDLAKAS